MCENCVRPMRADEAPPSASLNLEFNLISTGLSDDLGGCTTLSITLIYARSFTHHCAQVHVPDSQRYMSACSINKRTFHLKMARFYCFAL
jgi:hypothetical protein